MMYFVALGFATEGEECTKCRNWVQISWDDICELSEVFFPNSISPLDFPTRFSHSISPLDFPTRFSRGDFPGVISLFLSDAPGTWLGRVG